MARTPPAPRPDTDSSAELRSTFGKRVRAYRLKAGWTQSELSRRTGLAQEEISRIENGLLNLTIQTMSRLADVLGADVSDLFRRAPDEPKR